MIAQYGPILIAAFGIAFLATPLFRRLALRRNIVDRPDDWLKPHKRPIPYLGGVAIFCGWLGGILTACAAGALPGPGGESGLTPVLGVLVAGTLIMGIGLFDDLHITSPLLRLVASALVGILLMVCGVGDESVSVVAPSLANVDSPWLLLVASMPITLFVVLGACNATNMLDGLDGLCAGVLAVVGAGFAGCEILESAVSGEVHPLRLAVALAMLGGALGFLPYNRNPASIFMGDAGSMLLGLNAAILILLHADAGRLSKALGAVVIFGLPVADIGLTLVRRWRNQQPLMKGDRSHFYDQLVDRGFRIPQVARVSYVLAILFAVVGCAVGVLPPRWGPVAFFGVAATAVVAIGWARMVRVGDRASPPV